MLRTRKCSRHVIFSLAPDSVTQMILQETLAKLQHVEWKHRNDAVFALYLIGNQLRCRQEFADISQPPLCPHLPTLDLHILSQAVPAIVTACPSEEELSHDGHAHSFPSSALLAIQVVAERGDELAVSFVTRWLDHDKYDSM